MNAASMSRQTMIAYLMPSTHQQTCRANLVAATCRTLFTYTCLETNPCRGLSKFAFCKQNRMLLVARSEWVTKGDKLQRYTEQTRCCQCVRHLQQYLRQTERRTRFWNPHMETSQQKKKNSTQSSKLRVSCRSLYTFPDDGDE